MHWEPDVGFDPGSPGSRPGPKAGTKPLRHPGIPLVYYFLTLVTSWVIWPTDHGGSHLLGFGQNTDHFTTER